MKRGSGEKHGAVQVVSRDATGRVTKGTRRRVLVRALAWFAGALAWPLLPRLSQAQAALLDPNVLAFARGGELREGRVRVVMPLLADNGNYVALRVTVESPMTAADHVRHIALISSRNPEPNMARFTLGPRAGRADIATRVRLAGSQRVTAVAEMSDGSYWVGSRDIVVTQSACVDES